MLAAIRQRIESPNDRLVDIHVWCIGPNIYAAELVVVTDDPQSPDTYRAKLAKEMRLVHVKVEVQTST